MMGRFFVCLLCVGLWFSVGPVAGAAGDGDLNAFGRFRRVSPNRFVPLTNPRCVSAGEAELEGSARVMGLVVEGEARCYPLRQMAYHHVVNDTVGGRPLVVTYCVMADTAVAFERGDGEREFCVGGLFGGVVVLREKGSERFWAQIAGVEVPGVSTTETLRLGPAVVLTTFGAWRREHGETLVLAPAEGFDLYYEAYDKRPDSRGQGFKMNETITRRDDRLAPGALVFGLAAGGESVAWPVGVIEELGRVEGAVGGEAYVVVWDGALDAPRVSAAFEGLALWSRWYAWSSFYPETVVEGTMEKEAGP